MRKKILLVSLLVFALITLACAPCGLLQRDAATRDTPAPAQTVPGKATQTPEPDDGPTPSPDGDDDEIEVADLDALNSYRSRMTIRVQDKDETESHELTTITEWVRDPPAIHVTTTSGMEGFNMETILIGSEAWMAVGGEWISIPPDQVGEGLLVDWHGLMPDVSGMELVGQETVNGIRCKHYTSTGQQSLTVPDPEGGQALRVTIHGEVWIADQSSLPPVIIRERVQTEGGILALPGASGTSKEMVTIMEYDVYDVNENIVIEKPE